MLCFICINFLDDYIKFSFYCKKIYLNNKKRALFMSSLSYYHIYQYEGILYRLEYKYELYTRKFGQVTASVLQLRVK